MGFWGADPVDPLQELDDRAKTASDAIQTLLTQLQDNIEECKAVEAECEDRMLRLNDISNNAQSSRGLYENLVNAINGN